MFLNLVFHDVVLQEKQINNKYTVTLEYFNSIINRIDKILSSKKVKFQDYRIYFDDGRISFKNLIFSIGLNPRYFTLSIITDLIGKEGYMSEQDLKNLSESGVNICSHGVSHSALAIYRGDFLEYNDNVGVYQNSGFGKVQSLTRNEIQYQFRESKKVLENTIHKDVEEFILPYGLYNEIVAEEFKKSNLYQNLSSCDEEIDIGQTLRPRFLIHHEITVEETTNNILSLE